MEAARTVKLTGEPVSREMEDIIKRLNNNERVDIEEINATREITVARSVVNYSTPTDMLENRGEIRKNALNILMESGSAVLDENGRVSYNGNVKREARFDVVLGLPASGKSSSLCDKISEEFGSRIIDNDEAKKLLPEYNNGWGAGVVHDESQRVSEAQLEICLTSKENIVFPKVGGNLRKIEKTIRKAKRYGYKVYVHYVDLSRNKALGRMLSRFIETGRFLSPDLIEKYDNVREGNRILNTYNKLKERCDFNGRNDEGTMFMSAGIRGYGNIREEASAKVTEHQLEHPEMWENLTYEEWDQLYTKIGYGLEKEDLIDLSKYEDLEEKERRYSEYVKKNYEEWIKMTPKEQLIITKKIYSGELKP